MLLPCQLRVPSNIRRHQLSLKTLQSDKGRHEIPHRAAETAAWTGVVMDRSSRGSPCGGAQAGPASSGGLVWPVTLPDSLGLGHSPACLTQVRGLSKRAGSPASSPGVSAAARPQNAVITTLATAPSQLDDDGPGGPVVAQGDDLVGIARDGHRRAPGERRANGRSGHRDRRRGDHLHARIDTGEASRSRR